MIRFLFLFLSPAFCWAQIQIALFDSSLNHSHGQAVHQYLKKQISFCNSCKIVHFDFFNPDGKVDIKKLESQLQSLPQNIKIIHLSWNVPFEEKYKKVIQLLEGHIQKGIFVVAASGESQNPAEIALPIDETVMGQVNGAILVGELNSKGRLSNASFFGDKIKIKHPSIPGHPGSSFTSLIETTRIVRQLFKDK
jgi:hypothetical protein